MEELGLTTEAVNKLYDLDESKGKYINDELGMWPYELRKSTKLI
jgi:hypothetical protein